MSADLPKFSTPIQPPAANTPQMFRSVQPTLEALRRAGRLNAVKEVEATLQALEHKLHKELVAAGMIG